MKREKTKHPNLYKDTKSGIFYYRKGDVERSLKTSDEKTAQKKIKILLSTIDHLSPDAFKHKVGDLFPLYSEHRKKEFGRGEISVGTYSELHYVFEKHILHYFGKRKLSDVNERTWADYTSRALVDDYANHRKVFTGFLKWAKASGYLKALPDITSIPKHRRRQRRVIEPYELNAIFTFARGNLFVFLSLALFTGLRRKEIMTLKWDSVDLDHKSLVVKSENNKLRRARQIPLADKLVAILSAHKNKVGRTRWVFPNANKTNGDRHASVSAFKTAWATCLGKCEAYSKERGIAWDSDITWHDFRATFEKHMDKMSGFTDMQKEKMSDATKDTRQRIYVNFTADDLRGLENAVKVEGLDIVITGFLNDTGK